MKPIVVYFACQTTSVLLVRWGWVPILFLSGGVRIRIPSPWVTVDSGPQGPLLFVLPKWSEGE